jgi:hypothetical protein
MALNVHFRTNARDIYKMEQAHVDVLGYLLADDLVIEYAAPTHANVAMDKKTVAHSRTITGMGVGQTGNIKHDCYPTSGATSCPFHI